ncbi:Uncharacterised protein [Amycolatopsis camponoti]|uniref:Uncharacterized protein n=1 Tax=Amycolatopsis camponoti TaxID=2606593 RepID=A0A6I8LJE1_9PSEU|nr:hypothetical protein [Amycolatopsis camponoti]VVJ17684.1 Uncharacterised protein [Amycolatopsis camponoti]
MTDLDDVRRALRARESLAPDPGDVLATVTRRIRRRRTISVAAVTLTVAALGAGAVALLDRGVATVPPATLASSASAAPATGKVPPPAPAISLQDSSWGLLMWSTRPHFAALHYGQAHQYAFEIDVRDGAAPASALAAKPTAAGQLPNPKSVMWQDGPDRWIWARTTKPMTAGEMLTLLGKIGTTPPVVASPLKSVRVPEGQEVGSFTSEPETNTLVLCPGAVVGKAPLDSRCFSLTVSLTSHFADSAFPQDPLPVHQHRAVGAYTVEIDSSPANEQAARALLDSVRLDR